MRVLTGQQPMFEPPRGTGLIYALHFEQDDLAGLIKIGYTCNLRARVTLHFPDALVLAATTGTEAEEQDIHHRLRHWRARHLPPALSGQSEFYYPTDAVLLVVDDLYERYIRECTDAARRFIAGHNTAWAKTNALDLWWPTLGTDEEHLQEGG